MKSATKLKGKPADPQSLARSIEIVEVSGLKPHPKNYREHPEDQVEHLERSITEHGFYRNVVVARDGTILAGHGVVLAARKMGLTSIPVIRLDVDPDDERAIKVLIGDNEIARLTMNDDRVDISDCAASWPSVAGTHHRVPSPQ